MSRIGRKPIPVPPAVKVAIVDSTVEVEGPKGKLSFKHRQGVGVSFDQASRQIVGHPPGRRADQPRPARPDPQPGGQHGPGRHRRIQQEAGDRRRRLPGPAQEGQYRGAPGRLRQPGGARGAARGQRDGARRHPRHRQRRRTSRRWASSPPSSAMSGRPSPTRARGSATRARSSAARPARPSGRSNLTSHRPSRAGRARRRPRPGRGPRRASVHHRQPQLRIVP